MSTFLCWIPDYEEREDARTISAYDGECAAREHVEWYERQSSEYTVASGGSIEVIAQDFAGEAHRYVVYGERRPYYYARRK